MFILSLVFHNEFACYDILRFALNILYALAIRSELKFLWKIIIAISMYNTVILVRSVIKFLDRNFLFIEKLQAFSDLI